ncbi:MAG: hypothetical protein ACOCZJ_00595 [Thermoplasmatota archaeon]
METNRITPFIVVLILISSGTGAIAQSTIADEKPVDEVVMDQDDPVSNNANISKTEGNQKTLNKDYKENFAKDEEVKAPNRNDFLSVKKNTNFRPTTSQDESDQKDRSISSPIDTVTDNDEIPAIDRYKRTKSIPNTDETSDVKRVKESNRDSSDNSRSQLNDKVSSSNRSEKELTESIPNSNGDGELILDYYDITFQSNMTAISIDAKYSIYKIYVSGHLLTAEDIRDSPNTEEIMETLSAQMSDVFNDSVSAAFPEEQKNFESPTYDVGTSPGPVNVSCYADVYLEKSSYGFDENNTDLNMSDVLYGTTKMGAQISKDVDLKVKPGHNSTYRIHVPKPLITTSNDTIGFWGDSNYTFDDNKNRTCTWIYNNTEGSNEVGLSKTVNIVHQNPLDLEKEMINATSLLNMDSFEKVNITDKLEISTIDISGYTKSGTEESILPPNISGLEIITSDGLRMMLDNGLTNLQDIEERSLNKTVNNFEDSMENIFGEKPTLELEWDENTVSGYDVDSMKASPPLRCYFNSTEPVGFTNERLDIPPEADVDEVITETLKMDAVLNPEFNMTVEDGVYFTLKIISPQKVEFKESDPVENDRYLYQKEIDNRYGDNHIKQISLNICWGGEVRKYNDEDISANVLIDMLSFDEISINITMKIRSVKISNYGDRFNIPDNVQDLDYIDGDFIRVAVRNGLVELSTIYNQSIKDNKQSMESDMEDMFGENASLNFRWEDQSWKDVDTYRESYPDGLGDLKAYMELEDNASFTPDSFDLPEDADVGELVRTVLRYDATIEKDLSMNINEVQEAHVTVRTPEDIKIVDGERYQERWSRTYTLENGENTVPLSIIYDGEIREINEENVFINGTMDMQNLDSIDANISISISSININNYGDNLSIPESIYGLDFVDHEFVRTAIDNDLIEWNNITDEMNESVDEFEKEIPDLLGDFNLTYKEPSNKNSGPIRRYYEALDFKLNVTPEDKEDAYIDHELIEAIMNSGAVVDFEIPSVEDINENYTLNLKLGTPQFMNLHDDTGEYDRQNGYYTLDLREGFNGTMRSGVEGPKDQDISFNMTVNLHKIKIEPSPLKLSYKAHAKSRIDAVVKINSVELPEEIGDSLPDEINLSHANPTLIRQAETHGLFDRQKILGMLRNGSGLDSFEGMNQTLRDALDNQDIGVDVFFDEGTWESKEDEQKPLILNMNSDFKIHVAGNKESSALDLHSVKMGDMDIPSIQGIDTNFRILFPEGVRAEVEENEDVKTGWTDGGRHYVEVQTSGDSNESVTINPEVVLTHNLIFGKDLFLFNIAVRLILFLIIALILIGVGIKVATYYTDRKRRIVKKSIIEARKEEGDPYKWLYYISAEDKEKYDITKKSIAELGLQDEFLKQKKKAGIKSKTEKEETVSDEEEKTAEEDLPTLEEEIEETGIDEPEEFEDIENEEWEDELDEGSDEQGNSAQSSLEESSVEEQYNDENSDKEDKDI